MAVTSAIRCKLVGAFTCAMAILMSTNSLAEELIRIGVSAMRGHEPTLERWQPTADYLTGQIPGYEFEILPLSFEQVANAVEADSIQFVLVNASLYVQLEHDYGVSRIATLKAQKSGKVFSTFGSVIFSATKQLKLISINQLKGRRVAAVDKASLGGWQMALKEMMDAGIEPESDLASISFSGTHDKVVNAVLSGTADIGIVRTDHLEQMAEEGKIALADVSVLAPPGKQLRQFPFLLSTQLYPEWPFSRTAYTSDELAEKVAAALLSMPQGGVTEAARIAGWTVPYHYRPVRDLLKELQLPPYEQQGQVSASQVAEQYTLWLIAVVLALFTMSAILIRQHYLTKSLSQSQQKLEDYSYRLSLATQAGEFGVWEWRRQQQHQLTMDERMRALFQLQECHELDLYQQWLERIHPQDRTKVELALAQACQADQRIELEYRIILANNKVHTIKSASVIEASITGAPTYMVGICWDVTEIKQLEEENRRLITHDALTGKQNRSGFIALAKAEFERSSRYQTSFSVLSIDVDNFAQINSDQGSNIADQVLISLANNARGIIRATDYLCRWENDKFVALLLHTKAEQAQVAAQRLCEQLQTTNIKAADKAFRFTVGIGIAQRNNKDTSIDDTLQRADTALNQAQILGPSKIMTAT